jgi:hypothetical protein
MRNPGLIVNHAQSLSLARAQKIDRKIAETFVNMLENEVTETNFHTSMKIFSTLMRVV